MVDLTVRMTDPETVAFVEMRGAYAQAPQGFGRLYGWIAQHGLEPSGMPAALYLTMPSEVPEADAQWELWAPVAGDPPEAAPDEDGVGIKRVPATLAIAGMHRGPYETIAPTYDAIWQHMEAEGYEPAGPPMERYFSDPATVNPEDYVTEVLFPVRKR